MHKHLHYFAPHITVATVVQANGRFLMVEEYINQFSTLNQPAGHLESGESILAAATRELYEETGLQHPPTELIGIFQWTAPDSTAFLRFTFKLDLTDCHVVSPQDPDIHACHWLTHPEILAWPQLRSPMVNQSILCYQQGLSYPLTLLKNFNP